MAQSGFKLAERKSGRLGSLAFFCFDMLISSLVTDQTASREIRSDFSPITVHRNSFVSERGTLPFQALEQVFVVALNHPELTSRNVKDQISEWRIKMSHLKSGDSIDPSNQRDMLDLLVNVSKANLQNATLVQAALEVFNPQGTPLGELPKQFFGIRAKGASDEQRSAVTSAAYTAAFNPVDGMLKTECKLGDQVITNSYNLETAIKWGIWAGHLINRIGMENLDRFAVHCSHNSPERPFIEHLVTRLPSAGLDTETLVRLKDWMDESRKTGSTAHLILNEVGLQSLALTLCDTANAQLVLSKMAPVFKMAKQWPLFFLKNLGQRPFAGPLPRVYAECADIVRENPILYNGMNAEREIDSLNLMAQQGVDIVRALGFDNSSRSRNQPFRIERITGRT